MQADMNESNKRLTVKTCAEYLGISEFTLRGLVREKRIPHIRLSKKILFSSERIDEWLVEIQDESYNKLYTSKTNII